MKWAHPFVFISLIICAVSVRAENQSSPLKLFNHEYHSQKVFEPQGVYCETCHTFKLDPKAKRVILDENAKTAFRKSFKAICHDCHTSPDSKIRNAPHGCITCHKGMETLHNIKPQSHSNIGWSKSHGTEARIEKESCMSCHITSQCAECHLQRNDIQFRNHSRNFRFIHSIEARAQPQTCDSCHSRSFCLDCHLRRK